jgi:hypothetical protein
MDFADTMFLINACCIVLSGIIVAQCIIDLSLIMLEIYFWNNHVFSYNVGQKAR